MTSIKEPVDQAHTFVPAPPGHPLFSALRAALEARGFTFTAFADERYPIDALVATIVWDRPVRQALARELSCTWTEPGVVGDTETPNEGWWKGVDSCADELSTVLGARIAGTTADRWQMLIERVDAIREAAEHPPFVVGTPGAPDSRVQALGMAIDAQNGVTEHTKDTVARADEFHRFLLGVREHPSAPTAASTDLSPGILALAANPKVALRTRDDAIRCVNDTITKGTFSCTVGEAVVDALLAVPED